MINILCLHNLSLSISEGPRLRSAAKKPRLRRSGTGTTVNNVPEKSGKFNLNTKSSIWDIFITRRRRLNGEKMLPYPVFVKIDNSWSSVGEWRYSAWPSHPNLNVRKNLKSKESTSLSLFPQLFCPPPLSPALESFQLTVLAVTGSPTVQTTKDLNLVNWTLAGVRFHTSTPSNCYLQK